MYYIFGRFYGILPWQANSGKSQEICKKGDWDDMCQRFIAWYECSTTHLHGAHLELQGKQSEVHTM